MKKYNFLITPLGGRNAGTEAFTSLLLTDLYKKIVATDITRFSYGNHVCDIFYVQPYASSDGYIKAIESIVKKEEIDVIIPGSDYELRALLKHKQVFDALKVSILMNSAEVIELCMDKEKTTDFLKKNDFPYIKTESFFPAEASSSSLFSSLRRKLKCPFVVKPKYFSGGSNSISIIQDTADWNKFIKLNSDGEMEFIAQEYIDAPKGEFTVGVMSDTYGKIISSFALKRDLSSSASIKLRVKNKYQKKSRNDDLIISSGISQGIVRNFKSIRNFAEKVAAKLKSVGPVNIQCREDNKKIYIFEINPRFSGTTSIRAILGHNDVELIFYEMVKKVNGGQQKYKLASVVRGRDVIYKEVKS